MVQISLVEHITQELQQGYNIEQIKQQLKQQGYDPKEVDSSAQYAYDQLYNPQRAQNQRVEQLSIYVEQQLKAGYQVPQIKQYLTSNGYPYAEVDSAINLIQKPAKAEHKILIAAIVVLGVMGLAILMVTVMNIKIFSMQEDLTGQKELLDVKVKKLTTALVPGSDLDFQLDIFNLGVKKRYDLILDYNILDRDTGELVAGQKETFALETSTSKVFNIEIPANTKPGKYLLELDASYDDQVAKAGFIFDVYAAEVVEEITPELSEEEIPEMPPSLFERIQNMTGKEPEIPIIKPEVPQEENITEEIKEPVIEEPPVPEELPEVSTSQFEGMTKQEKIELIKRTAFIDPEKAIAQCNTFRYESYIRDCIIDVAKFKEDVDLCGYLNTTTEQDSCYMQMFIEMPEATDCSKVNEEQLKKSCNMLETANKMRAQFNIPPVTIN